MRKSGVDAGSGSTFRNDAVRVPHVRTSVHGTKKMGAALPNVLLWGEILLTLGVKAFEKNRFRPMYAGANMGHPYSLVRKGMGEG